MTHLILDFTDRFGATHRFVHRPVGILAAHRYQRSVQSPDADAAGEMIALLEDHVVKGDWGSLEVRDAFALANRLIIGEGEPGNWHGSESGPA